MEDRFKLNFWNESLKTMRPVEKIDFFTGDVTLYTENNILSFSNLKHGKLLQCTGLEDKNGKLIFEGDIVKKDHCEDFYVVEFCKKGHFAGAFCLKNIQSGKFTGFSQESIWMSDDTPKNWDEVIGNIYQNPELIKGEQE